MAAGSHRRFPGLFMFSFSGSNRDGAGAFGGRRHCNSNSHRKINCFRRKVRGRKVYERSLEDKAYRRERAMQRRQEQEQARRQREEEKKLRLEEKENEKILRMDKKFSGVILDTDLGGKGEKKAARETIFMK